jgi:ferrochelatase
MSKCLILANFGGPRNLEEVEEFLKELLNDQDVIQTGLPKFLHRLIFNRVAKKRAPETQKDYEEIGGLSPIYGDTEWIAAALTEKLNIPVITFHRYLPKTHNESIKKIINGNWDEIEIFPLFPQFTYATTGSLARFFFENLPKKISKKMKWVKSYEAEIGFINCWSRIIKNTLTYKNIKEEDTFLIFSAHGIPKKYVDNGDPYESQCLKSFIQVMNQLPNLEGMLSFQSKFGKGQWLRPYTSDVSENITNFIGTKKHVAIVPISFTSDHIETLFEIEDEYIPPIKKSLINAFRIPALNLDKQWIEFIAETIESYNQWYETSALIRK